MVLGVSAYVPVYEHSFEPWVGGIVQRSFSWGMVLLAYTMHGSFHDHL
jgi:hypothetical protein